MQPAPKIFTDTRGRRKYLVVIILLLIGLVFSGISYSFVTTLSFKKKVTEEGQAIQQKDTAPVRKTNNSIVSFVSGAEGASFAQYREFDVQTEVVGFQYAQFTPNGSLKSIVTDTTKSALVYSKTYIEDQQRLAVVSECNYTTYNWQNRCSSNSLSTTLSNSEVFTENLLQLQKVSALDGVWIKPQNNPSEQDVEKLLQVLDRIPFVVYLDVDYTFPPKLISALLAAKVQLIINAYSGTQFLENARLAEVTPTPTLATITQALISLNENFPEVIFGLPGRILSSTYGPEGNLYWQGQLPYRELENTLRNKSIQNLNAKQDTGQLTFSYQEDGNSIVVEIFDAVYAFNILSNSNTLKHTRFSLQEFGFFDPMIYQLLEQKSLDSQKVFVFDHAVQSRGEGDIVQLLNKEIYGLREISLNGTQVAGYTVTNPPYHAVVEKSGKKPNTVVLSFDDGPHPVWTREVLKILEAYKVKATFYVIGKNALEHPDVLAEIAAGGHEIANHTFNHPSTRKMSFEDIQKEITLTQETLAHLGYTPRLFREPFTTTPSFDTASDTKILASLPPSLPLLSSYSMDSDDWFNSDPDVILNNVENDYKEKGYGQILLHDAGGVSRQATLDALPKIITFFQNKNAQFVTSTELTNLPPATNNLDRTAPLTTYNTANFSNFFTNYSIVFTLVISLVTILKLYLLLTAWILKNYQKTKDTKLLNYPSVTVVIPCYNEEVTIGATLESVLKSKYKNFTILAVNDGSKDSTLEVLRYWSRKDSRIKIINLEKNRGKATAMNIALARIYSKYTLFLDSDAVLDHNAIKILVTKAEANTEIAAISGFVRVGNNKNSLTRAQAIEYDISQQFEKMAYSYFNSILVVPGAIGLWRTSVIKEIGYYHEDTIVEDTDLTVRALAHGYVIEYEPKALCYTEAPEDVMSFLKQRIRWGYGNLQILYKYRQFLFSFKHWQLGFLLFPEILINLIKIITLPFLLLGFAFILLPPLLSASFNGSLVSYIASFSNTNIFGPLVFLNLLILSLWVFFYFKTQKGRSKSLIDVGYFFIVFSLLQTYIGWVSIFRAFMGGAQGWNKLKRSGNIKIEHENGKPITLST